MSRRSGGGSGGGGRSGGGGGGGGGKGGYTPPPGGPKLILTPMSVPDIPPGAEVWYEPGEMPAPNFGRRAASNLVQGALGGLGLGVLWVTIVCGVFFAVTVGLFAVIIGVLYALNVAAGTI